MALAYTAPTWQNGGGVGISASQLQALSDCMEGLVQGSDKAITNIAISGQIITLTFADGSQETGTASGLKGIVSITKTGTSGLVDTYTIAYTDGNTSTFTVTNGATGPAGPAGPQGPQGIQGPQGDEGFSPGVTITNITGGHRVNITDADHPDGQNFDVMDGANAVIPNPQGTSVGDLTSIGINGDKYDIQGGGGADKADISAIGTNETGTTASKAYAVGEHFYKNSKFCTCTQAIAQGATFTLNTNYVEGTVADVIKYQEYIFDGDTSSYQYHVRAYRQGRIGFYELRLYCYPAASLPAGTVIDFGVIPEGLRCKNSPYAAAFSPDGKKTAQVIVYMDYSGATNNITMTLKDEVKLYGQINAYIPVRFQ